MIRTLGTAFAALLGLAFGSFLNVCLSRWPQGESVVKPASHCMTCGRTLRWCENIPLLSWVALRGRCHGCGTRIGWRYPLVEAAVGGLWAFAAWRAYQSFFPLLFAAGMMLFLWLLVALAVLDMEHLWLPDLLTLPAVALGLIWRVLQGELLGHALEMRVEPSEDLIWIAIELLGVAIAAALILLIRWIYWLLRHREGLGVGDAKLMAMLAAWLGLPGALLSFGIAVLLGGVVGLVVLTRGGDENRGLTKLPLGTFLCIGGIVSTFWGPQLIHAYLRAVGLS